MNKILIGDFRCKPFQQLSQTDAQYIIDDFATYSWFATDAYIQLAKLSPANSDIIIMVGLLDCINSCIWESLEINDIASNYIKNINTLISDYSTNNFYICAVSPVDGDYTTAASPTGSITESILNKKIETFNKLLKSCDATFIDSYNYLVETGFNTYDGIHYTQETSKDLQDFILSNLTEKTSTEFTPRLTSPIMDSTDGATLWMRQAAGGENPDSFTAPDESFIPCKGSALPNCVSYAWGRFYEIIGNCPNPGPGQGEYRGLNTTDPSNWYSNTTDDYDRSLNIPKLGAVACWSGHVAIVEQLIDENTIMVSESGYNQLVRGEVVWTTTVRKDTETNKWEYGNYDFHGFIYNPAVVDNYVVGTPVLKSQVTSSNESLKHNLSTEKYELWDPAWWKPEMKLNARYIWQYLNNKGWTLNAVAGMLGNMQTESYINPGVWQSFREWGTPNSHGYGLVQWTPYTKYTDWCTKNGYDMYDIDTALLRIEKEVEANSEPGWGDLDQWIATSKYNMSFKTFTKSTLPAYELGKAFLINYERPPNQSDSHQHIRGKQAESWYNFLSQYSTTRQKPLSLKSLKVSDRTATSIKVSFTTINGKNADCELINENNDVVKKCFISVDTTEDTLKTTNIIFDNLIPNKKYKIHVKVTGSSDSDIVEDTIDITTLQDYPGAVKNTTFSCENEIPKDTDSLFNLSITKPDYIGYWKDSCGYDIQLIVNNTSVATKVINNIENIEWKNFTIKDKFGYTCKIGDTVQIGARVWVKDDNNLLIFDNNGLVKTSKPICLLNKPITTYLNVD